MQNEVFARANGMKLGDVAQSMTIHDGTAYIVVNNSGIVFGIDPETFRIERVIRGIGSPRYICFNDSVAYVTSLYEPRIAVVDVATAAVADYIETPTTPLPSRWPYGAIRSMCRAGRTTMPF